MTFALIALRRADPVRCGAVLATLKDISSAETNRRCSIIDDVEQRIAAVVQEQNLSAFSNRNPAG